MDRLPTQSGGGTFRPPPYIIARNCITEFKPRSSVRERRSGGRTLRAQKIVKRCPSCKTDISDFLADPQINRDMMDVIESPRR